MRPASIVERVLHSAGQCVNNVLICPHVVATVGVEPHPTGHAPIRSHSGFGGVNGAQGESACRVKSWFAASQKSGSSQMLPFTPYWLAM